MPSTIPNVKHLTQSDFCSAALEMPDRASADQLVEEYARSRELDPNYVRWFIIHWTEKFQFNELATAQKLYSPTPHAAPKTAKA